MVLVYYSSGGVVFLVTIEAVLLEPRVVAEGKGVQERGGALFLVLLCLQISPHETLEPACTVSGPRPPSPQYHDMIAGRPASVLSGGGDDAMMYALGVLKWWRVAPRPAFFPSLLTIT